MDIKNILIKRKDHQGNTQGERYIDVEIPDEEINKILGVQKDVNLDKAIQGFMSIIELRCSDDIGYIVYRHPTKMDEDKYVYKVLMDVNSKDKLDNSMLVDYFDQFINKVEDNMITFVSVDYLDLQNIDGYNLDNKFIVSYNKPLFIDRDYVYHNDVVDTMDDLGEVFE